MTPELLDLSLLEPFLQSATPEDIRSLLLNFLSSTESAEERVATVESALLSPVGPVLRAEIARWIVDQLVPVDHLVPREYAQWYAPVRDSMAFVVKRLSAQRLAPKLIEQAELPPQTSPEVRLLRLIARVPGLQKLGQVLARNRRLRPSVRRALSQLENGIRDVTADEIRSTVHEQLGPLIKRYAVRIDRRILSEASVSAVIGFSWRPPNSSQRQRGVFKVLKPHIPACFAEDMDFLQALADHFGAKHRDYGIDPDVLRDTFTKVRSLLQHEVNVEGEQRTLREAYKLYENIHGVHAPRLIEPLCAPSITAITEEHGIKVTSAVSPLPSKHRSRVATRILDALVAAPLLAKGDESLFHADPHAGNLLYDTRTGELVVLDWALTEHLTREQRRHLTMLFLMLALRNRVGIAQEIECLAQTASSPESARRQRKVIRETADHFLAELPLSTFPSAVDAMHLFQQVAFRGVRFPSALIMFSKVLFTLSSIIDDLGGSGSSTNYIIARHLIRRWLSDRALFSPLNKRDWIVIQFSLFLYGGQIGVGWQQALLRRFLGTAHAS